MKGKPCIYAASSKTHGICRFVAQELRTFAIRAFWVIVLSLITVTSVWCEESVFTDKSAPEWKIGYWAWDTSYKPLDVKTADAKPLQLLYVQVGEYRGHPGQEECDRKPYLRMPGRLPRAENYVAVFRMSSANSSDLKMIPGLVESYLALKNEAKSDNRQLAGLQLDYDCPTNQLSGYALFLKALRSALPPTEILSITVLLDWFRPGTDIAEVIRQVDEFVPQFYDVDSGKATDITAGVARIIEPKWGAVFNSFAKPYRIGIAAFGRILGVNKSKTRKSQPGGRARILDANLLELMADNRLTPLGSTINAAGERLARYRNESAKKIDDDCDPAIHEIRMIIPTSAALLNAYQAAKAMGGQCKGVLFFRWPLVNEAMVFSQAEVERVISGGPAIADAAALKVEDGLCAAVSCVDIGLTLRERFPQEPVRFRIHSSKELEYIVPDRLLKPRMIGSHVIELTIPADVGLPKIHVGRAVSLDASAFTLEEVNTK